MVKFPDARRKYYWRDLTEDQLEILEELPNWTSYHFCEGWGSYVERDCNERCMCGSTNCDSAVFIAKTGEQ